MGREAASVTKAEFPDRNGVAPTPYNIVKNQSCSTFHTPIPNVSISV
jgi:hypothetical protein